MESALVFTWTSPYPGRERQALEFLAASIDFWGKQAADGRCSPPEWFFGLDGHGLWIVKGDRAVIEDTMAADPGRDIAAKGQLLLQDWHMELMRSGAEAEHAVARWVAMAQELQLL